MFYSDGEFVHSLWEFRPNMLKSKVIKQTNVLSCYIVPLDFCSEPQIDYWAVRDLGSDITYVFISLAYFTGS